MIPHNMTLFKFICVLYQFHRQTLPIMKIDRGQNQFRDNVSTGTGPDYEMWHAPTWKCRSTEIWGFKVRLTENLYAKTEKRLCQFNKLFEAFISVHNMIPESP